MMDTQPGAEAIAEPRGKAAEYLWERRLKWAAEARKQQKRVYMARRATLLLSIVGAILGTLCQQANGWVTAGQLPANWAWLVPASGWASAIALGLAAFFSREMLTEEGQRRWIESRTAAERYKSLTYLVQVKAPPYDKPNATSSELLAEAETLAKLGAPPPITDEEYKKLLQGSVLPPPMSVSDYIPKRVDNQIKYYDKAASDASRKLNRGKTLSLVLGGVAVILGVFGATYGWTAGWVAVISTIIASISANQYANRYQYLVVSYQVAAERLRWLKVRWEGSGMGEANTEARNDFITKCEQVLAEENNSWMAEWTKKKNGEQTDTK
jgi:hypothetical protein